MPAKGNSVGDIGRGDPVENMLEAGQKGCARAVAGAGGGRCTVADSRDRLWMMKVEVELISRVSRLLGVRAQPLCCQKGSGHHRPPAGYLALFPCHLTLLGSAAPTYYILL